ncbi:unnamed protein product [Ambrosiozyma monospora]|uniref:Unnamed protein product n=1 Tax=Ambrosiozyma monospora TaxID=43982 RepID=A0A9W6YT66_AMBMO|nr:unnamed protein product [Ambrosiozyma monospora]
MFLQNIEDFEQYWCELKAELASNHFHDTIYNVTELKPNVPPLYSQYEEMFVHQILANNLGAKFIGLLDYHSETDSPVVETLISLAKMYQSFSGVSIYDESKKLFTTQTPEKIARNFNQGLSFPINRSTVDQNLPFTGFECLGAAADLKRRINNTINSYLKDKMNLDNYLDEFDGFLREIYLSPVLGEFVPEAEISKYCLAGFKSHFNLYEKSTTEHFPTEWTSYDKLKEQLLKHQLKHRVTNLLEVMNCASQNYLFEFYNLPQLFAKYDWAISVVRKYSEISRVISEGDVVRFCLKSFCSRNKISLSALKHLKTYKTMKAELTRMDAEIRAKKLRKDLASSCSNLLNDYGFASFFREFDHYLDEVKNDSHLKDYITQSEITRYCLESIKAKRGFSDITEKIPDRTNYKQMKKAALKRRNKLRCYKVAGGLVSAALVAAMCAA